MYYIITKTIVYIIVECKSSVFVFLEKIISFY